MQFMKAKMYLEIWAIIQYYAVLKTRLRAVERSI